jgi:hypothetical protein
MPRETKEARKARVPLTGQRLKLAVPKRDGFYQRWVNDSGDRIREFKDAGYEFVNDATTVSAAKEDQIGERVHKVVGTREDGSPLKAYLMEQTEENYAEDQAAKTAARNAVDDQLKRGADTLGNTVGKDGRYVPDQGITIEANNKLR